MGFEQVPISSHVSEFYYFYISRKKHITDSVSYTHLDVYKRQREERLKNLAILSVEENIAFSLYLMT